MSLTSRVLLLVLLVLAIHGYDEYALRSSRDAALRIDTSATARNVAADLAQVASVFMTRQGRSMRVFQASQQWSRMSA